jgi:hypothetical protein
MVATRAMAEVAEFHHGESGDVFWINTLIGNVRYPQLRSKIIAGRDTDMPFIEKRTEEGWAFYPAPGLIPDAPLNEPLGFLKTYPEFILTLVPFWNGRGLLFPLTRFALEVAAGEWVRIKTPDCKRDEPLDGVAVPKPNRLFHQQMYAMGFRDDPEHDGRDCCAFYHPGLHNG